MKRAVLSPLARADIERIWDYAAEQWEVEQAESYIQQIGSAIAFLAEHPARGRRCDEIKVGYWKYRVGSHLLFYRVHSSEIDIVRVLHQRMDTDRHL
jgi:toxin ParE1/3/4